MAAPYEQKDDQAFVVAPGDSDAARLERTNFRALDIRNNEIALAREQHRDNNNYRNARAEWQQNHADEQLAASRNAPTPGIRFATASAPAASGNDGMLKWIAVAAVAAFAVVKLKLLKGF